MASSRKRRLPTSPGTTPGPGVPGAARPKIRDGDRRRRTVDLARLALERKEAEHAWNLDQPGPQDLPETDTRRG